MHAGASHSGIGRDIHRSIGCSIGSGVDGRVAAGPVVVVVLADIKRRACYSATSYNSSSTMERMFP